MAWAPLKYTMPLPGEGSPHVDPMVTRFVRADRVEASKEIKIELGARDPAASGTGIGLFWVPFAVLGLAAVGVAILAYKPPKKITSTLRKTAPKIGGRAFLGSSRRKTT